MIIQDEKSGQELMQVVDTYRRSVWCFVPKNLETKIPALTWAHHSCERREKGPSMRMRLNPMIHRPITHVASFCQKTQIPSFSLTKYIVIGREHLHQTP